MDDLITRQAALNALIGITAYKTKRELMRRVNANTSDENGWLGAVAECMDEIEDLPSAQPNTCDGCRWDGATGYGECHHCKRAFSDMYEEGESV